MSLFFIQLTVVFMGSAKYPDENAFDAFIKKHGGSTNAFTECERVSILFNIIFHVFVHYFLCIMYNGAKLWNSIPNEIWESKSLSCFQKKIAGHNF